LDDHTGYSLRAVLIELANALRYASGICPLDVSRLWRRSSPSLGLADDLKIRGEAARLAFEERVTLYGALYVSLAKNLGGRLVTYDGELLRKFPKLAARASDLLRQLSDGT